MRAHKIHKPPIYNTAVKNHRKRATRFKRRNISVEKNRQANNPEYYIRSMNMFDEEQQEFSSEIKGSNEISDYHMAQTAQVSPFNNVRVQSKATTESKSKKHKRKQSKLSMQCQTIPLIDQELVPF